MITSKVKMVSPNGEAIIATNKPILRAAASSGVRLDYNCAEGHCGACLKKLVKGDVSYPNGTPMAFIPNGMILTCCAHAESDFEIE